MDGFKGLNRPGWLHVKRVPGGVQSGEGGGRRAAGTTLSDPDLCAAVQYGLRGKPGGASRLLLLAEASQREAEVRRGEGRPSLTL
ncbi:hypothetical protein EYF80_013598 [Liparis tanakae]|uniref:Uncharacterized protein n=1 Tax=Liparis tanakae TaxID=230148 RepID=A0A4Z2IDT9_9TELE|nr:hypothetical protein EYF80_013598 [Liparis tanakae]